MATQADRRNATHTGDYAQGCSGYEFQNHPVPLDI